jgi:hypothetical protein
MGKYLAFMRIDLDTSKLVLSFGKILALFIALLVGRVHALLFDDVG